MTIRPLARRARLVKQAVFFAGLMGVAACATLSTPVAQTPFALATHRMVKIEPCDDQSGFVGERNLKEEATRIFTDKVQAMNVFQISADAPLTFTCNIESFS